MEIASVDSQRLVRHARSDLKKLREIAATCDTKMRYRHFRKEYREARSSADTGLREIIKMLEHLDIYQREHRKRHEWVYASGEIERVKRLRCEMTQIIEQQKTLDREASAKFCRLRAWWHNRPPILASR